MGYQLLQGDCLNVLQSLPAASVHCCVTSPPYFGLRDYGHEGQIGLESTVTEYVAKLVEVFREVRRVLRIDGTLWLNLGDSYAGSWGNYGGQNRGNGSQREITNGSQLTQKAYDGKEAWKPPTANKLDGIKPKDLIGVPWRVAFALQDDGWWLRSDIIWAKPNPMPESVTDRPTKAHEYLFLLAKSSSYYYDSEAIKEPAVTNDLRRPYGSQGAWQLDGRPEEQRHGGELRGKGGKNAFRGQGHFRDGENGPANRDGRDMQDVGAGTTRNRRDVWTVATKPYPGAHFATYPVELVEPCIMAGTPAHGVCSACGASWVRELERTSMEMRPGPSREARRENGRLRTQVNGTMTKPPTSTTTGWHPSCDCNADVIPATVLDPFNGSGTTGSVAVSLGREYIGIDINPDYIALARQRIGQTQPALLAV